MHGFAPGFRCSVFDGVVLLSTAIGAGWLAATSPIAAIGLAFVVGHFFLFCNVFRIRRLPELVWAGVFTGLSAATILGEIPGWPATFLLSGLATVVVLVIETRHPAYHGLFWQRINPGLPEYWREMMSQSSAP